MKFLDASRHELLINQILSARTLPEAEAAQAALRRWWVRSPDDWGILDGGEHLSPFHDALLEGYIPFVKAASWTEWQWLEYQAMQLGRNEQEIEGTRKVQTKRELTGQLV